VRYVKLSGIKSYIRNLGAYFDWECEVDHTFGYHDFKEHEIVSTVPQAFIDFASSWWDVYCVDNNNNKPIAWNELKSVLRHRFVPPSYQHDMLRKLA
jgi:hypothetical protein